MEVSVDKVAGANFGSGTHVPHPAANSLSALFFGWCRDVSVVNSLDAALLCQLIEGNEVFVDKAVRGRHGGFSEEVREVWVSHDGVT